MAISAAGPLGGDAASRSALACQALGVLVDLYLRGMREPLPLALRTSAAWASAARAGRDDPAGAACSAWVTGFGDRYPKEDDDPAHRLVYAGRRTWSEVLAAEPLADERGAGWGDEPTRAGRLSQRLWADLLAFERPA